MYVDKYKYKKKKHVSIQIKRMYETQWPRKLDQHLVKDQQLSKPDKQKIELERLVRELLYKLRERERETGTLKQTLAFLASKHRETSDTEPSEHNTNIQSIVDNHNCLIDTLEVLAGVDAASRYLAALTLADRIRQQFAQEVYEPIRRARKISK